MKKVNIYILTLFLPWFLSACDDYLKEDSDDLLIPSLVNDYVPILLGEGYPDKFGVPDRMDSSDDGRRGDGPVIL